MIESWSEFFKMLYKELEDREREMQSSFIGPGRFLGEITKRIFWDYWELLSDEKTPLEKTNANIILLTAVPVFDFKSGDVTGIGLKKSGRVRLYGAIFASWVSLFFVIHLKRWLVYAQRELSCPLWLLAVNRLGKQKACEKLATMLPCIKNSDVGPSTYKLHDHGGRFRFDKRPDCQWWTTCRQMIGDIELVWHPKA
jgi:hypothetical protein